jgi:hypothetical protein
MNMARRDPQDIIAGRVGIAEARSVLKSLDNNGYAVITKSEYLELRRKAIKLAKMNGAVPVGTRTGRMSVKKPNLAQAPRSRSGKTPPVVQAEKVTRARQASKDRTKATRTNTRATRAVPAAPRRRAVTRKGL